MSSLKIGFKDNFMYWTTKIIAIALIISTGILFVLDNDLVIVSSFAMYNISLQSFSKVEYIRIDRKIKAALNGEEYNWVKYVPVYILAVSIFVLGILQNIRLIRFGQINNLIITVVLGFYLLYQNEKSRKLTLSMVQERKNLIEELGEDKVKEIELKTEEFMKEFNKEIKNISKKK